MSIHELAEILDHAAIQKKPIAQIAKENELDSETAYEIQRILVGKRIARGEHCTGFKMGLTNKARRDQLDVYDLTWGFLTSGMRLEADKPLQLNQFIAPSVETEIAFHISKDIQESIPLKAVPEYVDQMAPALEIVDVRYKNFDFSLEDVIADNCFASAYVLGNWKPIDPELNNRNTELIIGGNVKRKGKTNAVMNNPLQTIAELSRLASKTDTVIKKGQIVLSGAITPAVKLTPQQTIKATVEGIGNVSIDVE